MPSTYHNYKAHGRCPRCGVYTRGRAVLCGKHRAMCREEKSRLYAAKVNLFVCVWSGCWKPAVKGKRMCKGHLTDNRVNKASRKQRAIAGPAAPNSTANKETES